MFDFTLTDNFQHQSRFFDTENITRVDQRKNAQISDNYIYFLIEKIDIKRELSA